MKDILPEAIKITIVQHVEEGKDKLELTVTATGRDLRYGRNQANACLSDGAEDGLDQPTRLCMQAYLPNKY